MAMASAMLVIALVELNWLHVLFPLENRLSDTFIQWRANGVGMDPDIVIVDIDERSLALLGDSAGRWPWPRSLHAELIQGVGRQHPRAMVFDILFSDADMARPEADRYFAEVISASDNLFFPFLRLNQADDSKGIPLARYGKMLGITPGASANPDAKVSMVLPLPVMLETGRLGAHNIEADADGVVRSYPLYLDAYGWHIPSLPARVASKLGMSLPAGPTITLNWHGQALSYQRVSYADVYLDLQRRQRQRPADEFKGKIVIIGSTATGLHDIRATPVSGFYPGVEILAVAIDNLKNRDPLWHVPGIVPPLLTLLLLSGTCAAFMRRCHPLRISAVLLVLTPIVLWSSYLALARLMLLPLLTPLLFAWAYCAVAGMMEYWNERKAREKAVRTFSRFLDPRMVKALIDRGETTESLSGHSSEISVLFSDIRGFTALSEGSRPEQVVELLNSYFSHQAEAIFEQDGTLDKYIGDAIMAFWGAPAEQSDHAFRAITAALAMSERVESFRATAGELGRGLEIGIGVHSGPAVVGFIGAANRQDYTAIGDTVNLASRIEGQTKGVCRVLVSEECKVLCERQAGPDCPFEFVDRGSCQVKGRLQMVHLFEPRRRA